MTDNSEDPRAWHYQSDFLREAQRLIKNTFLRAGIEEIPLLGLAAVGWWGDEKYKNPPFVEIDPQMRWRPNPAVWPDAVAKRSNTSSEARSLRLWATRASASTEDLHDVVMEELQQHDSVAETYTLVSEGARVGSYDCVFVLEFMRAAFEAHPHTVIALSKPERPLTVGLVKSVSDSLLSHLANEARKGDAGLRGLIDDSDISDVLRDAGSRLLSATQLAACDSLHYGARLFQNLNTIALLRYESSEPRATIVLGKEDHPGPFELKFKNEVPLTDSVWARKIIQLASGNLCMFSDTEQLLGLVHREQFGLGEFWVRLKGQGRWELGVGPNVLADVSFAIPSLPMPRLNKERFTSTYARVFPSGHAEGMEQVWHVVESAFNQRHGALIVVTGNAEEEATRLAGQSTPVEPVQLSRPSVSRATAIDGAILLDPTGICHGIGVILDGAAHPQGTPSRGARFNSAVRYIGVAKSRGRLAIVISEDGQVNLLPRLRPQIKFSEFIELLEYFLFHPKDEPVSPDVKGRCATLMRDYGVYVQYFTQQLAPDLDDDARRELLLNAMRRYEEYEPFDRIYPTYDPHESDLIFENPEDTSGFFDNPSEGEE